MTVRAISKPSVRRSAGVRGVVPLGEIIQRVAAGVSVNGEDRRCRPGELGVLKLSAIAGGRFRPDENKAIREDEKDRAARPVRKGSLLMSRSNTLELVGTVAFVDADWPHLFLPDLIWEITLKPNSGCNPEWLACLLQTQKLRQQLQARASGTSGSMKKLATRSLLSIAVAIPPPLEQEKVVQLLTSFEWRLNRISRLIELKSDLKGGISGLLFQGVVRSLNSGDLPSVEARLGDLFTERNETDRVDLPLLSITADRGVILRSAVARRDSSSEDKHRYKRITHGDIGYNTMRMWQGVSGLSELEGIVSPAYTVCTPNDRIDGRFAAYLFKHPPMVNLFFRFSQGLVDDTLNLKFQHFSQIRVSIPPIEHQRRIASTLHVMDEEILALRKYFDLVMNQKQLFQERLLAKESRIVRGCDG